LCGSLHLTGVIQSEAWDLLTGVIQSEAWDLPTGVIQSEAWDLLLPWAGRQQQILRFALEIPRPSE
jgi:hypothetical protein